MATRKRPASPLAAPAAKRAAAAADTAADTAGDTAGWLPGDAAELAATLAPILQKIDVTRSLDRHGKLLEGEFAITRAVDPMYADEDGIPEKVAAVRDATPPTMWDKTEEQWQAELVAACPLLRDYGRVLAAAAAGADPDLWLLLKELWEQFVDHHEDYVAGYIYDDIKPEHVAAYLPPLGLPDDCTIADASTIEAKHAAFKETMPAGVPKQRYARCKSGAKRVVLASYMFVQGGYDACLAIEFVASQGAQWLAEFDC